jgi:hypothetical protein
MIEKLAYRIAGSGRPAVLAQWAPGLRIAAESPGVIYPDDGAVLVNASFQNPWKRAVTVRGLRLMHVTMGEMLAVAPPERLKALPGPDWLPPEGFSLEPGQKRPGRLAFACKKLTVSLPCSLEASADIGQPTRAGVLCVPVKDLEEAAKKAAEKKAKAAAKAPEAPKG